MILRPTRLGLAFLGLVMLTLIGCINYSLSLGFLLTFLLGGVWVMTSVQALRIAQTTEVSLQSPSEGVAGQELRCTVQVQQGPVSGTLWLGVMVYQGRQRQRISQRVFVHAGRLECFPLTIPAPVRGRLRLGEVQVLALDALGLWKAWRSPAQTPLESQGIEILISPALELNSPPAPTLPARGEEQAARRVVGAEEFAGLRGYTPGDSPRLISWRHAARTGTLLTRQFDAPLGTALHLDWLATAGAGGHEQRLSRLATWVARVRKAEQPFALSLPGLNLPVAQGEAQVHQALHALALQQPWPEPLPNTPAPVYRSFPLSVQPFRFTLLALLLTLLPNLLRQPLWASAFILIMLAYTALRANPVRRWPTLPSLALFALALGLGFLLDQAYGTLLGAMAGTAMLAILLTLKAAETRTVRDAKLLTLLGLFITSTQFFYSQGPLIALSTLLSSSFLLASAIRWVRPAGQNADQLIHKPALRHASRLMLLSSPLALLLFAFFPRPDGPLWQLPLQKGAQTGLSDEISAGEFSNLAQSQAVAFRADFEGGVLPPVNERYWRGPVYELFDGQRWQQSLNRFSRVSVEFRGLERRYTLTMEPHGKPWLLNLDVPSQLPPHTYLTNAFQAVAIRGVSTRTRYQLSIQTALLGRRENPDRLELNLKLPAGQNPQATALAAQWRSRSPAQRVQAALQFLAQGGYSYTLDPPLLPAEHRIDAFLFESKRGFCEHYASAFAFLMRAAGVPTRLIGGYQGGEVNPNGGYLIIRQQDAHAWTEVWLSERGWVRVDPTAVIAPARITTDLVTALVQPHAVIPQEPTVWSSVGLQLDALQNQWNIWVVGYNGEQQRGLLGRLGIQRVGSGLYLLGLVMVALLVLWPSVLLLRRVGRPRDPAEQALLNLTQLLRLNRLPGETITAYTRRASEAQPQLAEALAVFGKAYHQVRYAPPGGERVDLLKLVREMKRAAQR